MKKFITAIIMILLITGCSNVNDLTIEDVIANFQYNITSSNKYRVGYKYYLPRGMQVEENTLYNEVITNNKTKFYLYVDMISYFNKKMDSISYNEDAFHYSNFSKDDLFGYLVINEINNKYLIEIMYNYAKIEVMINNKEDITRTLIQSVNILNSVVYNDIVIKDLIGEEKLKFSDEEYDIFKTKSEDSEYLKYDDTYIEENNIIDQDLLKQEGN